MANQCLSSKKNLHFTPTGKSRSKPMASSPEAYQSTEHRPLKTLFLEVAPCVTCSVQERSLKELESQISLAGMFLKTVNHAVESGESMAYIPVMDLIRLDDHVRFQAGRAVHGDLSPAVAKLLLEEYTMLKKQEIHRKKTPLKIAYSALAPTA